MMRWSSHVLLTLAVAAAVVAVWAWFSIGPMLPSGGLSDALGLLVLFGPFAAIGWVLDRAGVDRPARRVGVAYLVWVGLTLVATATLGGAAAAEWRETLLDPESMALPVLLAFGVGFLVVAVLGSAAGAWLRRTAVQAPGGGATDEPGGPAPPSGPEA